MEECWTEQCGPLRKEDLCGGTEEPLASGVRPQKKEGREENSRYGTGPLRNTFIRL